MLQYVTFLLKYDTGVKRVRSTEQSGIENNRKIPRESEKVRANFKRILTISEDTGYFVAFSEKILYDGRTIEKSRQRKETRSCIFRLQGIHKGREHVQKQNLHGGNRRNIPEEGKGEKTWMRFYGWQQWLYCW